MSDRKRPLKTRPRDAREKAARQWICLFVVATVTCFACAPRGKVRLIKPGHVRWEEVHNLAVRGFDGHYGEMVRNHIYSRLTDIEYFNPTDAIQIHTSGRVPSDTMEDIAFLQAVENLKADAVITGYVAVDIHDIHGFDELQVKEGTGYYKKAKNAYGEWVDEEIKRTVIKDIPYVIRKASFSGEYRVFDLRAKGVIVLGKVREAYEEKFGGEEEYGGFGRKLGDLPSSGHTSEELSGRIAKNIVAELSRMRLARSVKLDRGRHRMVKRGVALAKRGKWQEAIGTWEQVIRDDPDNAAAYYNLGVAHEGLGDTESLKKARDLYKTAAGYGQEKLYSEGIKRVDSAMGKNRTD